MVPVIRQRAAISKARGTAQGRENGGIPSKSGCEKSTADPLIFTTHYDHTHDVPMRRGSVHGVPAMFLKSTRRSMRSFARDFVETGGVAQWLAGVTFTACAPATQGWV
jgi:hypothetical protein